MFGQSIFFSYLCNMKKILCLSPLCHGIKLDSGSVGVNSSEFDAQKRNDNIVMKLTNINHMNERTKFIDCKKLKKQEKEIIWHYLENS